jgi:hypothetical protein
MERHMQRKLWMVGVGAGVLACGVMSSGARAQDCAGLKNVTIVETTIKNAEAVPAGSPMGGMMGMPMGQAKQQPPSTLPAFCKVTGVIQDRTGADGKHYGINFELRMPANWNGKFYFQGGGGMDGSVSPAIGSAGRGLPSALERGYAVVSDDSGHSAMQGGAFGHEQQARLDFANRSTPTTARVAKQLIATYYGSQPKHSYFVGCSNGGREAMMAVERSPLDFDGAVAGDPGFRLAHAAVAEAWDTQVFDAAAPKDAAGKPILSKSFSNADMKLLADAVVAKCDGLDGLKDGMINNFQACKFDPAALTCKGAKTAECLTKEQVTALKKSFGGAHDSKGNALYSSWPYDAGVGDSGWRMWKLGTSETSRPNAANATMGATALLDYFVHPYVEGLTIDNFDFDRAAEQISQTASINDAVDTDLSTFAGRGGKLIIYEGLSDPVFSADDIMDYYRQLEKANGGLEKTEAMARLFMVPGMSHCGGGPATDQFDSLTVLEKWVEQGQAPQTITATGASFPGRTRPLCPYPQYAAYNGSGNPEDAKNFTCKNPQ